MAAFFFLLHNISEYFPVSVKNMIILKYKIQIYVKKLLLLLYIVVILNVYEKKQVYIICIMDFIREKRMKYRRRLIALLLSVILMLAVFGPWQRDDSVSAALSGYITADWVNFRNSPAGDIVKDGNGNNIQLCTGHPLSILDTGNTAWYKVQITYNNVSYTGYVSSQYVKINNDSSGGSEASVPSDDADFEAKLTAQGFPESYKNALRALHEKHPSWEFKAVHTNIEWSTLLANECNKQGQVKNLVWTSNYSPNYNWRSTKVGYDFATDRWSAFDGSMWFAASDELVTYYLDPRTYLDETYIFVFESLSYHEGVHNIQGIEAILNGTFMYNTRVCDVAKNDPDTRLYSEVILEAAKATGVSPYHIASRIKQEMGSVANDCAKGTSGSYPGIYNYFNIGANDSADGSAALKGLEYASKSDSSNGRPWNTVEKSIKGGALFLGKSYINVGQDTLYTQKFNVTNRGSLFSHQYMTNVQAPASECVGVYKAYNGNGILDSSMAFNIPVYLNMPEAKTIKPNYYGHPNNWLRTLSVEGYSLTPTFAANWVNDYSLIVPKEVESIKVSAATVNSTARITSGTGVINLSEGTNYIYINVQAQNGNVRTYKLVVVRGTATPVTTVDGNRIKGDLNGDGKISTVDIVKVQRIIVGLDALTDDILAVADINGDGKVSTIDIVKIQRHIVGLETIQ